MNVKDHNLEANEAGRVGVGTVHGFKDVRPVELWRLAMRLVMMLCVVGGTVLVDGFYKPPLPAWGLGAFEGVGDMLPGGETGEALYIRLMRVFQFVVMCLYWLDVILIARQRKKALDRRMNWVDIVLLSMVGVGTLLHVNGDRGGWWMFELAALILCASDLWRVNAGLARRLKNPGILLPLSFITLILIGTPLLKLPHATPSGMSISWLDALFTMTSAVCVTGLGVRSTATGFTPFGQTVILIFVQLGGLGIIIFASMFAMLIGRSLSIREHVSLSGLMDDLPLYRVSGFVRFIVLTTLAIELIGALLMMPMFAVDGYGEIMGWSGRFFYSLFHSVSAFCNAGFDLTGQSMAEHRYSLGLFTVMMPLIVIGGIGFPVLSNLADMLRHRVSRRRMWNVRQIQSDATSLHGTRMTLHTKVVLVTTLSLFVVGTVGIFVGEVMPWVYQAADVGVTGHAVQIGGEGDRGVTVQLGEKLADASFMSVSARTAGFSSVSVEELHPTGQLVLISLMMVGGSPGGTAGGVKTTVIALLILGVIANMRQRKEVEAFGRTISNDTVKKAGTLFFCYIGLIMGMTYLLTLSEPFTFLKVFFEVVSAATTTGLSMGITQDLTSFGKCVIIVTMFLGRVGPLALLGALVLSRSRKVLYRYPHEDVVMG
ncbi:TrkH family potassium uptake protein [Poriferisphaera sp. WC338]|uniref:TrkH family potassium uptake protein n=1 Tax=Poriferisphaera sp. WC338 TaxID=3425129 RepID=UPI003D81B78B